MNVITEDECFQLWTEIIDTEIREFHICILDEEEYIKSSCSVSILSLKESCMSYCVDIL